MNPDPLVWNLHFPCEDETLMSLIKMQNEKLNKAINAGNHEKPFYQKRPYKSWYNTRLLRVHSPRALANMVSQVLVIPKAAVHGMEFETIRILWWIFKSDV
jgi:hypothetical protein